MIRLSVFLFKQLLKGKTRAATPRHLTQAPTEVTEKKEEETIKIVTKFHGH